MKKISAAACLIFFVLLTTAQGVIPKKWELQRYEQFLKGKFKGISLSYEGILSLAPKEIKMEGPSEEFYLSLLFTPNGELILGTGHAGKIYRIGNDGKAELYFQVPEMDIYCLARDVHGNIYAGSSPNGKIWRITEKGQGEIFFNPKEKYIWDLMFTESGSLLAAVGETGGIYEITGQSQGILVLKAEENHILCMDKTGNGDLIAGSGGKGRVYRMSQNKRISILFESPFEEVKAITQDGDGNIYVAAGGSVPRPQIKPVVPKRQSATDMEITVTPAGARLSDASALSAISRKQPGALFRISRDGIAKKIWNSDEDMIYCLYWDSDEQRIVFGTGNKGRIFTVDKEEKASLLLQKNSEQVNFIQAQRSKVYVLENNPSVLSIYYPEQSYDGEYTSRVYDAEILSSWGLAEWEANLPDRTFLQVQTRSGNASEPNQTWSDWSPPHNRASGEQILNPKGRYIQFKALFKAESGKISPELSRLTLFYQQTNIAPRISTLEILPPNTVFLEPMIPKEKIWGFDVGAAAKAEANDKSASVVMAKKAERKGYRTIVWNGTDENGDSLLYSLFIRSKNENQWRLLKETWVDKIFTFDTISFPDGEYTLKLVASDSPTNPVGMEKSVEKTSRLLVVDNSLPVFSDFEARRSGSVLKLKFIARDSFSRIKEVKYLVRPAEWMTLAPVDGINDSKQESFDVTVTLPAKFDNMVTVKLVDEYGNVGVFRAGF